MDKTFSKIADRITEWTGSAWATILAVAIVISWLIGLVHFGAANQNYQLLINTGTTIITFIMVFLIQHSTNAGTRAIQVKLDALIEADSKAKDKLVGLEDLSDAEIKELQREERAEANG